MPKEMMTRTYAVTGRAMLDYLGKLSEKELALPFVGVIQLMDGKDENDYAVFPCVGLSVLPNDLLGFHVAHDARVKRIKTLSHADIQWKKP
jgi:hypothetical protein